MNVFIKKMSFFTEILQYQSREKSKKKEVFYTEIRIRMIKKKGGGCKKLKFNQFQ